MVAQEYVKRYRQGRKLTQLDENAIENIGTVSEPVPQHFDLLAKATDTALHRLPEQDKLVLRLYYLDARALAEIGRLLHRHESSIARRLDKVLGSLRKEIVQSLAPCGNIQAGFKRDARIGCTRP